MSMDIIMVLLQRPSVVIKNVAAVTVPVPVQNARYKPVQRTTVQYIMPVGV